MKLLVTGGAGYIGAHTVVELCESGHEVVIVDNLVNASEKALDHIRLLTGKEIPFYRTDIRDEEGLRALFEKEKPEGVIHFAGLKAVGESTKKPLLYYDNNIGGTLTLLRVMRDAGCKKIIFSSSATVYGTPKEVPIREDAGRGVCTNPYGQTKAMIEQILTDVQAAEPEWDVVLLRYFNPIGAHESGELGENPNGIPNNLMPYITQVAVGRRDKLHVFGNDYDTPDGTGVRDYIHVVDLARGHVAALKKLTGEGGVFIYNLGTGQGYSVLDIVREFEAANGIPVPYDIDERRPGDIASCYACADKAFEELGWKAEFGIRKMCEDAYRFQKKYPNGY